MKRFVQFALAVLVGLEISTAEAAIITGDITFGGTLASSDDLSTITVVDFTPQQVFVTSVTGDLDATIDAGNLATFLDFAFNPFVPNNPLWSIGGFSFNLESLSINTQNTVALVLLGQGRIVGPVGFDPTPYDWSFSADRTHRTVAFSATNAATPAPEPGTLLLLGSGLVLLAVSKLTSKRIY